MKASIKDFYRLIIYVLSAASTLAADIGAFGLFYILNSSK